MKGKSRGRRVGFTRERKPKTYEQVVTLNGQEFWIQESTGVYLYLEDVSIGQQIYLAELLTKFYRINEDQLPLVLELINDTRTLPEKVWYAVMRGNFFIEVVEGRNKEGPHQTKLWFRTFTDKKSYWIATLQLMAFYFNENEIREALLKAISEQEFFMLPNNRDKAIVP